MIFSKDKWTEEVNAIIPVSTALSFNKMVSSLEDAWRLFIIPLFGQPMADAIQAIYDNAETDKKKKQLLAEAQHAVVNLAMWYNYTEHNIRITDMGFQRQETETFKSTFKYQEDDLRHSFKNKGFNALDRMIEFLNKNQDTFPDFKNSPACTLRTKSIVQSAAEVDKWHFINRSHLIFLRLLPIFKVIEDTVLQPHIGSRLYTQLQSALQKGTEEIEGVKVESLREKCSKVVIFLSLAKLLRQTYSITDRGLYFVSLHQGDGSIAAFPADRDTAVAHAAELEHTADICLSQLLNFIQEKLPAFFGGRESSVLDRDNDNKKTFWA